jgi:hypothetical protein
MITSDLRAADVEAKEFALRRLSLLPTKTPNERPIRHTSAMRRRRHPSPMAKNRSAQQRPRGCFEIAPGMTQLTELLGRSE